MTDQDKGLGDDTADKLLDPPEDAPESTDVRNVEQQIIALTNRERAAAGVAGLTENAKLSTAARNYAVVMRDFDELGHSVGGQTVVDRLAAVGYRWRAYGENVAFNMRPDAELVMRQWMTSPGHRANILSSAFTEIGVGLAGPSRRGRYYYCQLFGRPAADRGEKQADEATSSISGETEDYASSK